MFLSHSKPVTRISDTNCSTFPVFIMAVDGKNSAISSGNIHCKDKFFVTLCGCIFWQPPFIIKLDTSRRLDLNAVHSHFTKGI